MGLTTRDGLYALLCLAALLHLSSSTYPYYYFFCDEPETPENGYRIGNHFGAGYGVQFKCNPGYFLVGSEVIYCVPYKYGVHWNAESPVCLRELKASYDTRAFT